MLFDDVFERLAVLAYRVASRVMGPAGDPENVAAETVARAQVHWPRVADHAEAWVVTVAGRLAVREARRRQRSFKQDPSLAWGPNVDAVAERMVLAEALRRLSRPQREAVTLRYLADLPETRVAHMLGCSESTVRTHARRGLANLRRQLTATPSWLDDDARSEESER